MKTVIEPKSNRSNRISILYNNIWETVNKYTKDSNKTKEIMDMVWKYGDLQFSEGQFNVDPEGYPDLPPISNPDTQEDCWIEPNYNMYDMCYCTAKCITACGRKQTPNEQIFTSSNFTNYCKSFKKK